MDDLRALLERFPYWPHAPQGVAPAQVATYALGLTAGATWTERRDASGRLLAAVGRIHQPWDSEKLGRKAGRLFVVDGAQAPDVIATALAEARAEGYGYLLTRVDSNDLTTVQTLEAAGFRVVDAILSQYLRVKPTDAPAAATAPGLAIRETRPDDADALAEIADLSFTRSRFHDDPWIGPTLARTLYREWAGNIARGLNDLTLVAERTEDARVVGFLSCLGMKAAPAAYGWGYGRIELVAVHPDHRGRGAVRAMTARLIADAAGRGWELLGIGTQIGNVRAIRAYAAAGFVPGDSIFTLRWRAE
jgi:ribosomal protein S18 acetylase RimI-like enzyme